MQLSFLRTNAQWLAAGGLLTFGSSFGQTYFISLYAGVFREEFSLSHTDWGSIYAVGTLASAALVLMVGGLADRYRTRTLATFILLLFATVCIMVSQVREVWVLPVLIFGLRFCGQGMMSHIAVVSIGRWFAAARGKAISVTAMGYSVGESLLPISFVALTAWIGWRGSWGVAALLLLMLLCAMQLLLRGERNPRGQEDLQSSTGMEGRHWKRRDALKHWLFWATLPGFLAQPVFGTAFFFQQVHLTELKGWTLASFVSLIPIYTATSVFSLFLGGWAVDRFGSARVLPFYLMPLGLGFCIIAWAPNLVFAGVGLAVIGMMQGLSASVIGAFWPEYYGTKHLGAIRSVAGAVMVFATALGPAITGFLIDAGFDYRLQLIGMAGYAFLMCGVFAVAMRAVREPFSAPV